MVSCGCGVRVAGRPELMRNCGRGVVLLGAVATSCCCCEAGMVGAEIVESPERRSKGAKVDEERLARAALS